jgi:hypothetical protein
MSWLIDNANAWYVLFGIIALGFAMAWWVNRDKKYLIGVVAALGCLALVWLLTRLVVTDRLQLQINVRAMADATLDGKADLIEKHLARDFHLQGRSVARDALAQAAVQRAKQYGVHDIVISAFDVEELTAQSAKVFFRATVHHRAEDRPYPIACRGQFVREDGQWKLKDIQFFNALVNQNQPITVPLP